MSLHARIVGIGSQLPAKRVANSHFADYLNTSDEWIRERTGIHARYLAEPGTSVCDLAEPAARKALADAQVAAADLDLIVVATTTPDRVFPATACLLQDRLGAGGCPAFDVQAVCTGFLYALSCAEAMFRAGRSRRALVVGADIFSRLLDWQDRSTCILFGDGAGAVVLADASEPGIAAVELGADGSTADALTVPGHPDGGKLTSCATASMDGKLVFKLAVQTMLASSRSVCSKAGIEPATVDWMVPHQANERIIDALADRLGVDADRVVRSIREHGNTSAASIPLGLDTIKEHLKAGTNVLMTAAGGGFTWGAAVAIM